MEAVLQGDVTRKLGYLSKFMGDNNYLNGSRISFVDISTFEVFEYLKALRPKLLDQFPNLNGLHARVLALPRIKAYRESERFKKAGKFLPGFSKWNN